MELVRDDRHLLLGGEYDIGTGARRRGQHVVEPLERIVPERGDPVQGADVTGEPCHAQRVGDHGGHLVPQLVQSGGHLAGGQSRTFGQENSHDLIYIICLFQIQTNPLLKAGRQLSVIL